MNAITQECTKYQRSTGRETHSTESSDGKETARAPEDSGRARKIRAEGTVPAKAVAVRGPLGSSCFINLRDLTAVIPVPLG